MNLDLLFKLCLNHVCVIIEAQLFIAKQVLALKLNMEINIITE